MCCKCNLQQYVYLYSLYWQIKGLILLERYTQHLSPSNRLETFVPAGSLSTEVGGA